VKYPVLIAVLATFAVSLDAGEYLSSFERKTLDARYRFHARPAPHTQDIVILHISEESIRSLEPFYGRWPWPRSVHAEAIEYLESDGASAIGFDILFPEKSLRQEVDSAMIHQLKALAKNADIPEVRAELQQRLAEAEIGELSLQPAVALAAQKRLALALLPQAHPGLQPEQRHE